MTNWLTEVYATLSQVIYFVTREESQLEIFLSAVKPGLVSKYQEVAEWVVRIYIKSVEEMRKVELAKLTYEWFTNQCIMTSFLCI